LGHVAAPDPLHGLPGQFRAAADRCALRRGYPIEVIAVAVGGYGPQTIGSWLGVPAGVN
jgi:hypothetical protein